MNQNSALAYAARIYQRAQIPDTAILYAQKLINLSVDINKITGYQILLSPELRPFINSDSIESYIRGYYCFLNHNYNENQKQLVLDQQNFYNYNRHEKNRKKAEAANVILKQWILVCMMIFVIMAFALLYLKIRNQKYIIKLHQAIDSLNLLKIERYNNIYQSQSCSEKDVTQTTSNKPDYEKKSIESLDDRKTLRERLRKELLFLYTSSEEIPISSTILNSEVYDVIVKKVENGSIIKEQDNIWKELEEIVLKSSPNFLSNLRLLTLGNLTSIDLRTALLVKCGFKPSQMTILFGRSNGAIISRLTT